MSRFGGDGEDFSDYADLNYGRWERNEYMTFNGRPGRQALADLLEALEAMPRKRLIESRLAREGDVCSVGAYAAHKIAKAEGITFDAAVAQLEQSVGSPDDEDDYGDYGNQAHETALIGKKHGMSYTMAWAIGERNDEYYSDKTPEERWQAVHDWIAKTLAEPPQPIVRRTHAEVLEQRARKRDERRAKAVARRRMADRTAPSIPMGL